MRKILFALFLCLIGCNTQEHSAEKLQPQPTSTVVATEPATPEPQCSLPKYADAVLGGKDWAALKNPTIQDRQAVLIAFGYDLGQSGIDGVPGEKTVAAWESFRAAHSGVPSEEDGCKMANAIIAYRITTPDGLAKAINSLSQEERNQLAESVKKSLPKTPCSSVIECQQFLINNGYYIGDTGADGVYGLQTSSAWSRCHQIGVCPSENMPGWQSALPQVPSIGEQLSPGNSYVVPGNGYGEISPATGLPRTNYVRGYTRSNGTVVQPYYRSHR